MAYSSNSGLYLGTYLGQRKEFQRGVESEKKILIVMGLRNP